MSSNPKATLEDLIELAQEGAQNVCEGFTEPDEDWHPLLVFENAKGVNLALVAIPFQPNDDGEKDLIAMAFERILKGASQAVFMASAWMTSLPRDVPSEDRPRPSEAVDREECLMIYAATPTVSMTSMAKIHRTEDAPPTLGEWDTRKDTTTISQGRFPRAIRRALVNQG